MTDMDQVMQEELTAEEWRETQQARAAFARRMHQKLRQALKLANKAEKLRCHVRRIEEMLERDNFKPFEEVWVDYFNGDAGVRE